MTQDLYYYESGYVDNSYFVYTADAESLVASSGTMSVAVGVIKHASSAMTVTSSTTATISHIEGADLFALAEAAITVQVTRIRDNNVSTSGVFTTSAYVSRVIHFTGDDFSNASVLIGDNLRVRYSEAATSAAFSLGANIEVIPGGEVVNSSGSWISEFTIDAKGTKKAHIIDCHCSAQFTQTVSANRLRGIAQLLEVNASQFSNVNYIASVNSSVSSTSSLSSTNRRLAGLTSAQNSTASVNATVGKIEQFSISLTSAFSPTLTASVFKNSFAVLDATSSLASNPVVTRLIQAQVSSASTVSCSGKLILSTSCSLSSSVSISINGLLVSRNIGEPTVVSGGTYGDLGFDSTIKKFGSHSLKFSSKTQSQLSPYISYPDNDGWSNWKTIDFWFYAENSPNIYDLIIGQNDPYGWRIIIQGSYVSSGNYATEISVQDLFVYSSTLTVNAWHHVRVVRNNSGVYPTLSGGASLYIDGTRVRTDSTGYIRESSAPLVIGKSSSTEYARPNIRIDELVITKELLNSPSATSITVPTSPWVNTLNTNALYHFDNNYLDDNKAPIVISGNLSSSAQVNAQATKILGPISAALSSQATLTVSAKKFVPLTSNIQSEGFLVSSFGRIRPFVDIEASTFSLSASPIIAKTYSANLSSSSTVSCNVTKTFGPIQANLNSQTTLSADGRVTTGITISLESNGFLLASFGRIRPFVDIEASEFSLSATAQTVIIGKGNLTSHAEVNAQVTKTFGPIQANLSSSFNTSVHANIYQGISAGLTSTASLNCANSRIRAISSAIASNATLTAGSRRLRDTNAHFSSAGIFSAKMLRIKSLSSNFSVISSELTAASKIGVFLIDCPVTSALSVTPRTQAQGSVFLDSSASVVANTKVTKPYQANLASSTNLTTQAEAGIIGGSDMLSNTNMSTSAIAKKSAQSQIVSTTTLTASEAITKQGIILEWALGTLQAQGTLVKPASANISSTTSLFANSGKSVVASANLQAQGFVLAVGRDINLGDADLYVVPKDNNNWTISKDNNEYIIEFENREFKI